MNHSKYLYVDKKKVQDINGIHPLPILTSSGNGKGEGDYVCNNEEKQSYVGSWAGDELSVERSIPVPECYQEIIPNFTGMRLRLPI